MMNQAVLYARVSTDEQAEHGYSLESQLDACRAYAENFNFEVLEQVTDGHSGAKLDRPGLDRVRELIDGGFISAVVVHSPDRLTRNLAHSLLLREEWQRAGIELHYCNRGKSEDTPESRMAENIEAVFGDYWRAKIIESSRRGRRKKAANGRWPCDGHAPYGYQKEGEGREAHLVIDQTEAAIIRRMFDMYIGAHGQPLAYQTIASTLTAEGIQPPNRGIGKKKPGKAWYRATVRKILTRRSYIGEFEYSDIEVNLPELAIVDQSTFEAAQKRREKSKARFGCKRKYNFLLAGHVRCACGMGMSADPMQKGHYRYYACNSDLNKHHARGCNELRVRADDAEVIVWDWVSGLLCDEEKLEMGLSRLSELKDKELENKREELDVVRSLLIDVEKRIERLAAEFAIANDEAVASALKTQLRHIGRERQALAAEEESLKAEIAAAEISEADREAIREAAAVIRERMQNPTFEQARALFDLLDVQVELEYQSGKRGIKCTCGLKLTQDGKKKPTWKILSSVGQSYTFTTTT